MNRRAMLAALASLPFVGRLVPATAADINPEALIELEIEFPVGIYAHAGETVTCENGHPICDFAETVNYGQMQDPANQLGNWRQQAPRIGDFPIPGCAICGSPFTSGSTFHIGADWRGGPPSGLRLKPRHYKVSRGDDGVALTNITHPGA